MVNKCGQCDEDTGSSEMFWCSPECYNSSHTEIAAVEYEWLLSAGFYSQADWWRSRYGLVSLADKYVRVDKTRVDQLSLMEEADNGC